MMRKGTAYKSINRYCFIRNYYNLATSKNKSNAKISITLFLEINLSSIY